MKNDERCFIICNSETALKLIQHDKDIGQILVITEVLEYGVLIVISETELLNFIFKQNDEREVYTIKPEVLTEDGHDD